VLVAEERHGYETPPIFHISMSQDNPYSPPNSVVGQPNGGMSANQHLLKRPASHKLAISIFGFTTAGFIWFFTVSRSVHIYGLLLGPAMIASLGGMLFRKHSKSTYYTAVATLSAFVAYIIWVTYVLWGIAFRERGAATDTFFGEAVFGALLVLLFVPFAFGRASREYYGFPVPPKKS
jgi:hypothetical protein